MDATSAKIESIVPIITTVSLKDIDRRYYTIMVFQKSIASSAYPLRDRRGLASDRQLRYPIHGLTIARPFAPKHPQGRT